MRRKKARNLPKRDEKLDLADFKISKKIKQLYKSLDSKLHKSAIKFIVAMMTIVL